MPPASSLFAERPVPAPPPMIGSPRAICSRNRLRMPCLELSTVTNVPPEPIELIEPYETFINSSSLRAAASANSGSLMCRSSSRDFNAAEPRADRVVQRPPRGRIVERLALSVDGRHAARWQQHRHGTRRG